MTSKRADEYVEKLERVAAAAKAWYERWDREAMIFTKELVELEDALKAWTTYEKN